jgi:hypothetical protein
LDRSESADTDRTDLVRDVLAHHGIKGMKWGSRKSPSSSGSSSKTSAPVSNDHATAEAHKSTIKTHGTKALSNDDLQQLITRMNLEQQHRNLTNQKPSKFDKGHNHVKKVLSTARTLNDVHNVLNSPLGKAAKTAYKTQRTGKSAYKVYKVTKSE